MRQWGDASYNLRARPAIPVKFFLLTMINIWKTESHPGMKWIPEHKQQVYKGILESQYWKQWDTLDSEK